MANKAFVGFNPASLGSAASGTVAVDASGVIVGPDGTSVGPASGTIHFHYAASSKSIHEMMADAIRDNAADPDLVVVFLDWSGHF